MIVVSEQPKASAKNKPPQKGQPLRPDKRISPALRKAIYDSLGPVAADVANIVPWLQSTASPAEANRVMRQLQDKWRGLYGPRADEMARRTVAAVNGSSKSSLEKSLTRSLGVNMAKIVDDATVKAALELGTVQTSGLIKSIPQEYLQDVEKAVMQSYLQQPFAEGRSLSQELAHIYGGLKERAAFISRDQTSKLNSLIDKARCEELGIEKYIWRTAKDNRVVGKPGGMYPNPTEGHGNHWAREGKIYRLNEPPADGPPGWPYNCRCYAEPIIDVNKLKFI